MKSTIAIAVSGGVDSLTAAFLLKRQGHPLIGIHFRTGYESGNRTASRDHNSQAPGISNIARQLGIPVEVVDIRQVFEARVVDYFTRTYQKGQTPNPCLVCNPLIKFGTILQVARDLGASSLATGHYARIERAADGSYRLMKGLDTQKDQSYFLAFLNQAQLSRARFPLGGMTKSAVKLLAAQEGLQALIDKESQDVCFIDAGRYTDFLARQPNFQPEPGLIEDTEGRILGEHNGLHRFTIGQRRGIGCPAAEPYYVVRLDQPRNRLVVGFKAHLESTGCRIGKMNWIRPQPRTAITAAVRLRYRHRAAEARVTPTGENTALVRFRAPQTAVAPGQGAVLYRDDEVLGGGWIETGLTD